MCDFKPGDEVVCVDAENTLPDWPLTEGAIYTVLSVGLGAGNLVWLRVTSESHAAQSGWRHSRFRKVQRRDLSAWLETADTDTDHLDKPIKTPARPEVDALLKRVQSGAFG